MTKEISRDARVLEPVVSTVHHSQVGQSGNFILDVSHVVVDK